MTQLIGLVDGQREAGEMMKSLIAAGLDGSDIHIIEEWPDDPGPQVDLRPGPNPDFGVTGTTAAAGPDISRRLELGDEEAQFFKRSVQKGGVLVVVEASDTQAVTLAKRILEAESNRVVHE